MSKNQLQLAKFLPALIFILVPTISIMAGWLIGTNFGRSNPEIFLTDSSSQAAGQGGISGGLWGLVIGSFLGFGGFGLVIAWVWRRVYSNMQLRQTLLLVLGWMFVPVIILLLVLLGPF